MEGHHAELERHTGRNEDQTERDRRTVRLAQRDRNASKADGTGCAVKNGHAEQQQPRGECTEHEVLHRRFCRRAIAAFERHQCVHRQAEKFKPEVGREHARGAGNDHHAQRAEQDECHVLAIVELMLSEIRPRISQGHSSREEDRKLEQR